MSILSNRAESALLNALAGKTGDFGSLSSAPATWFGLATAAPSEDGVTLNEISYGGYARVQKTESFWDASANGGSLDSNAALTFPQSSSDGGVATHLLWMDASTAGNLILAIPLNPTIGTATGITPTIAAGNLQLSAD